MFKVKKILLFVGLLSILGFANANTGNNIEDFNQCISKQYTKKELYENIKKAPKSAEDLGRYVGYGGRDIKMFAPVFGQCFSFFEEGKKYCEIVYKNLINTNDASQYFKSLENLKNQISKNSKLYKILSKIDFSLSPQEISNKYKNEIVELQNYINSNVIYLKSTNEGFVYNLPYKYLTPFNVVFNWSLQNLSSYYTDIGYIWLIYWFLVILAFVYGILTKNKILSGMTFVSIMGFLIWWMVGSSILWYGIGLIIWTMFSFALFFYYLTKNSNTKIPPLLFLFFIFALFLHQIYLNFARISSQGGAGPFAWYKQSNGWKDKFVFSDKTYSKLKELGLSKILGRQDIDKISAWSITSLIYNILRNPGEYASSNDPGIKALYEFTILNKNKLANLFIKFPYTWEDVFGLQFAHYNRFLPTANNRSEDEGIFIGGTYMRYFIHNQKNVIYDHMLVGLWEWMSDGDICKAYHRIRKDKKIKYIIIDPNIGTVVRFDNASNKTLFDRFFADIDLSNWTIRQDGVMTNFIKFIRKYGYSKLFYTNNLGIKYAIIAPDQIITSYIRQRGYTGEITDEDIYYFRYALAGIRYPWSANLVYKFTKSSEHTTNIDYLVGFLVSYILQRSEDPKLTFINDILDILGSTADPEKIKNAIFKLGNLAKSKNARITQINAAVSDLNEEEREKLALILRILNIQNSKDKAQMLAQYVNSSIGSQTQLFIIEMK